MAVRIRLSRFGRLHRPFYRIIAIDSRRHREGEASEVLGSYDPLLKDKNIVVDMDRVNTWIGQGALVSVGLTTLLKHHGYPVPVKAVKVEKAPAKGIKKKDGKKFVKATRRSLKKHEANVKAKRKAETAAAAAAKAAAAPAAAPEAAPQA